MEFLRRTLADTRLRYHVSKVLSAAITSTSKPSPECLGLTEQHPTVVLGILGDHLNPTNPQQTYAYLLLLEKLVDSGSFSFHLTMALDCTLQDKLVKLASKRAEGEAQRKVRRLARLMLLEFSRMFVDVPELQSLTKLAGLVEKKTGRNLMRAIVMESRRVSFIDPRPEDIILISPVEGNAKTLATPPRQNPAVWSCHVCTYLNKMQTSRCFACGCLRATRITSPPLCKEGDGTNVPAAEILNGVVFLGESSGSAGRSVPAGESEATASDPPKEMEENLAIRDNSAESNVPSAGHNT